MATNGQECEVISKREAIVIRMLNDALAGNQKAFGRFVKFWLFQSLSESNRRRRSRMFITNLSDDPEEHETSAQFRSTPISDLKKGNFMKRKSGSSDTSFRRGIREAAKATRFRKGRSGNPKADERR